MAEGEDRTLVAEPFTDRPLGPARVGISYGDVGPELPGELADRGLVVGDRVDLRDPDPSGFEAVTEGRDRQAGVVLDPGEALLLGGGHEPAVLQEAAGRLVEESRDADDVQRRVATCFGSGGLPSASSRLRTRWIVFMGLESSPASFWALAFS